MYQFIRKVIKEVPAILTYREAELLYRLAKNSSTKGVILEIGTYKGGSAIILGSASKNNCKSKVYAIDPHVRERETNWGKENVPKNTLHIFLRNLKKFNVQEWVTPIVTTSEKAAKVWNKPISLLWIDGDHDFESVKKDFLLWEKHLIKGGVIAIHDSAESKNIKPATGDRYCNYEAPPKIVKDNILKSKRFSGLKVVDSTTYAIKFQEEGTKEIIRRFFELQYLKVRPFFLKIDEYLGKCGNIIRIFFPRFSLKTKKTLLEKSFVKKFKPFNHSLEGVQGMLSEREKQLLYSISYYTDGPILEIGPLFGLSTLCIAYGIKDSKKRKEFISVELNPTLDRFKVHGEKVYYTPKNKKKPLGSFPSSSFTKQIRPALLKKGRFIGILKNNLKRFKLNKYVKVVEGDFNQVTPNRKYKFIFCDALHTIAEIKANSKKICELVSEGTILACHDICNQELKNEIENQIPIKDSFIIDRMYVALI